MSTDDEKRNPFTTWYFLAAAVAVGVVVILGVVLAFVNRGGGEAATPAPAMSSGTAGAGGSASPQASAAAAASVCGLEDGAASTTVATAPEASWAYQGTTAYPTSPVFGPGTTAANGVRSCFQHSATGAVFAAANAVAQGSESATAATWLDSFLSKDSVRTGLTDGTSSAGGDFETGVRANVTGFKVLNYTGQTATVDMAVTGSAAGQTVDLSMVYRLVWEDGDWKLQVTDPTTLIDASTIPNLAGYVSWGP